MIADFEDVLGFWFDELEPKQWWLKDAELDLLIAQRFAEVHRQACACECVAWREQARGRLAEVIVLDQFSRNIFRDTADAFRQDPQALALAQEAVSLGANRELTALENSFLYMPYMHSESLSIHDDAVKLFEANGIRSNLEFEHKHRQIIERFGRYPHRNTILGRSSTGEELDFLKGPNASF